MNAVRPSKVYLIGAGPGDPGLITVRGAELIGRADAILYDVLVNGGKTPVANVPLATWNAEIDQWRPEYLFTAYLTEPVLVTQLAGRRRRAATL